MQMNRPEGVKLAWEKSLAVSAACMATYWPTPGFKGRTFKLCVLTRGDLNFCVRSSPLRGTYTRMLTSVWYYTDPSDFNCSVVIHDYPVEMKRCVWIRLFVIHASFELAALSIGGDSVPYKPNLPPKPDILVAAPTSPETTPPLTSLTTRWHDVSTY